MDSREKKKSILSCLWNVMLWSSFFLMNPLITIIILITYIFNSYFHSISFIFKMLFNVFMWSEEIFLYLAKENLLLIKCYDASAGFFVGIFKGSSSSEINFICNNVARWIFVCWVLRIIFFIYSMEFILGFKFNSKNSRDHWKISFKNFIFLNFVLNNKTTINSHK